MPPTVSTHIGDGAMAVTPHHSATEAALEAMRSGGNAADAVVAANAVLGVVLPTTCGVGGDLFAIVHCPGTTRPEVLNASGRGGSGVDAAALRAAGHSRIPPYDPSTVSVPGCVDGWEALLARHGRLSLTAALARAIEIAEAGFEASEELAGALDRLAAAIAEQPSARALYPEGRPPKPGTLLRRPDMARTLEAIAESGRSAFYGGDIARAISTATGGILSETDLARNTPDWVDPIGIDLFGLTGWTVPPNSQGYITLAAAWAFARLAPPDDVLSPEFHHAAIESYRAFAWERNDLVADPQFAPLAPGEYLSTDRLAASADAISLETVAKWPNPTPGPPGTAYFSAVDSDGMAVSCIQSNYFGIGSRISAGETGIFLHNRAAGFSLLEGHPNEAAPGKRPLHTLSPTLWTRGTDAALVLGTRGGDQQPQYLLQAAAAMLYAGLDPEEAQALPRWSIAQSPGADSVVAVEAGMSEDIVDGLVTAGHTVVPGPDSTAGWGPVSIISIDETGVRRGAADPRVSTAAAGGD